MVIVSLTDHPLFLACNEILEHESENPHIVVEELEEYTGLASLPRTKETVWE